MTPEGERRAPVGMGPEPEARAGAAERELAQARLACSRQPDDLPRTQNLIAVLTRQNRPIPDDIQERSLRLLLREHPHDLGLSRALIALLHRTGRPLFPDLPAVPPGAGPHEPADFEALLRLGDEHACVGDTFGVYAAMWQACVRHPQTARGWAEFARALADRQDWNNCRIAVQHVLEAGESDAATADAAASAMGSLAERGELAALDWRPWVEQLPPPLRGHPNVAKILLCTGDAVGAVNLLPSVTKLHADNADTWIIASMAACEAERPQEVYDHMRRAFTVDPSKAVAAMTGERFSHSFSQIVRGLGKVDELADWISERSVAGDGVNLVPLSPAPEGKLAVQKLRQTAVERGLPSVLLVTQGKSASVTVGSIFSTGFSLPTVLYALSNLRVVSPWLQDYLNGGACYVTHLFPSPRNIELLVAGGARSIIVHVRDPRQGMVAMAAHRRQYAHLVLPSQRESAIGGPAETIAAVIRDSLARRIAWIDGWVRARAKLTVHFTTFEAFVRDRDGFLDRMLSLYGGDTRFFDRKSAFAEQPGVDYHRRRGSIDEWKEVLTSQQIEHVNGFIPAEFWNLFGWER